MTIRITGKRILGAVMGMLLLAIVLGSIEDAKMEAALERRKAEIAAEKPYWDAKYKAEEQQLVKAKQEKLARAKRREQYRQARVNRDKRIRQQNLDRAIEDRNKALANHWHYYAMQESAARRAEYRARGRVHNSSSGSFEKTLDDIVVGELGDVMDFSGDYDEQYTIEMREINKDRDRVRSGKQKKPTDFNAIYE